MEQKIYLHNLDEGVYKTTLKNFTCTDCGLVPHYKLSIVTNRGFDIKFDVAGWDRIDNQSKCPICSRKKKILKLMQNVKS